MSKWKSHLPEFKAKVALEASNRELRPAPLWRMTISASCKKDLLVASLVGGLARNLALSFEINRLR